MIPCTNVAGGYAAGNMTTARRAVIFATSLLTITSKNRLLAGQVLPWTLGSLCRHRVDHRSVSGGQR